MRKANHLGNFILRVSMIAIFFSTLTMNNVALAQNVTVTDDDSYIAESSAMLDVMSTNKGMLVPRLTTAQRTGITSPATGLMVYDTEVKSFMYYNGLTWITIPQLASSAASGEALFAVVNHLGDTVFAVYHDGVRIFVDPEAKGRVGGFAISGRTPTKEGIGTVEYFRVTPDSTRIYVNDSVGAKGRVGGFAISGRTPTKENGVKEYFTVNKDSTRIYIDSTASKGRVGGFAVSGRTPTKAGYAADDYFNISAGSSADLIPSDARIAWYPKKEAFLAGRVLVQHPDSVGLNSFSTGYHSMAKGKYSQAFGYEAKARGEYSTSIGRANIASGKESIAVGLANQSTGWASATFGYNNRATNDASTAIGVECHANGRYSVAMVRGSQANGEKSVAIGFDSYANHAQAVAIGERASALGVTSVALGRWTTAFSAYETVMGSYNTDYVTGNISDWVPTDRLFVVGNGPNSSTRSNALTILKNGNVGIGNITPTALLHTNGTIRFQSLGLSTVNTRILTVDANGNMLYRDAGSWATGLSNINTGTGTSNYISKWTGSTTQGNSIIYDNATNIGINTTSPSYKLHVAGDIYANGGWFRVSGNQGLYFESYGGGWYMTDATWIKSYGNKSILHNSGIMRTDGTFQVGDAGGTFNVINNGNLSYRTNVLFANTSGYVGIGTTSPSHKLTVVGNVYFDLTSRKMEFLASGEHPIMRPTESNYGYVGLSGQYYYRVYTASIYRNNEYSLSDKSVKKNINDIENPLQKIMSLKGRLYEINTETHPNYSNLDKSKIKDIANYGFIAQELKEVLPEMVEFDEETGFYMIRNQEQLLPVLVEAIKEQQTQIEENQKDYHVQQKQIELLKSELEAIKAELSRQK
jgi:hypothetical protein